MQNPLTPQKILAAGLHDDPAKFCFRYRGGRRHHRLYDVLMTLDDAGDVCHIEVYHALPAGDDLPPFASGHLDAARLTRAVDLLGLVKRVAGHDHTMRQPGKLIYEAHMQLPWLPMASAPYTQTRRSGRPAAALRARAPSRPSQAVEIAPMEKSAALRQARVRVRYPLHALRRGAQLMKPRGGTR